MTLLPDVILTFGCTGGYHTSLATVLVWDLISGKCLQDHSLKGGNGCVAALKDGRLVIATSYPGFYVFRFPAIPDNRLVVNIITVVMKTKLKFSLLETRILC